MLWRALVALFLCLSLSPAQRRLPKPSDSSMDASRAKIEEAFELQLSNSVSNDVRSALAGRMARMAETEADPANKLALLQTAQNLLEKAGEFDTALEVLIRTCELFALDELSMQSKLIGRMILAPDARLRTRAVQLRIALILRATRIGSIELAESEARLAEEQGSDGLLGSMRRQLLQEARSRMRATTRAQLAGKLLEADPDDPSANATFGTHYCLVEERWHNIDLLALKQADKGDISNAAQFELESPDNSPTRAVARGDRWWSLAGLHPDFADAMRRRAAYHYAASLRGLGTLDQLAFGKRIDQARKTLDSAVERARQFARLGDHDVAAELATDLAYRFPHLVDDSIRSELEARPLVSIEPGSQQLALPELYSLREDGIDNKEAFEAVRSGLHWLAAHQDASGRWSASQFMEHDPSGDPCDGAGNPALDVGTTSLAMLAFMACGNTPSKGDYSDNVARGARWLASKQEAASGIIGGNNCNEFIYCHSLATLALAEAYGLSGSSELRGVTQSAISYLERHRNPSTAWRYQYRDGDNDTSVVVVVWMALRAARDFGLEVGAESHGRVLTWIDAMTDPLSGRAGYTDQGGYSSRRAGDHAVRFPRPENETMTGAALFCRYLLGQSPDRTPIMNAQAQLIASKPPRSDADAIDFYGWFYGTNALRQYGGRLWADWYAAAVKTLLHLQSKTGSARGSWNPVGVWGEDGGRIYSTAMAILTLMAPARYADMSDIAPVPDEATFRRLRSSWLRRDFEGVERELRRLDNSTEGMPDNYRAALQQTEEQLSAELRAATQRLLRMRSRPDFLTAESMLETLVEEFGDLDPGLRAEELLRDWRRDDKSARELKAARDYNKIIERARGSARESALRNFIERGLYSGTQAHEAAMRALELIR